MRKPKLIVMVGLSASGKSTIAKRLSKQYNAIIVSSDAIREEICGSVEDQSKNEEVFKLYHDRIRKLLEKKENVIADATNITMKSRRAILNKVNGLDIEKVCYIVPKKYEECCSDNLNREHPVPDFVIKKQLYKFEIPFYEEGWDKIKIADFTYEFSLNVVEKMIGFDQKNPHHTMDLYNHSINTVSHFEKMISGKKDIWLISAFLHDVGKLMTQTFDEDDVAHYYQHHCVGSYYILSNAVYNMFGIGDILDICFLINYHMMPFSWNTDKVNEKWKRRFRNYKYDLLLKFNECDKMR